MVFNFFSTLLWTTVLRNGLGCLFARAIDGSRIRSLFSNTNHCARNALKMSGTLRRRFGKGATMATLNDTHWDEDLNVPYSVLRNDLNSTADVLPVTHPSDYCNCPENVVVSSPLALDSTNMSDIRILWVEAGKGHIWTSDLKGCRCSLIINATKIANDGKIVKEISERSYKL